MKKILFIVLLTLILCMFIPTVAFADSYSGGVLTVDGNISSGTLLGRAMDKGILDPTDITQLNVTATGTFNSADIDYINSCTNLEILNVANSITCASVGDTFLCPNTTIEEVTFPAVSFGEECFSSCSSLTTVSLPNAKTFGMNAFESCTALTAITLPEVTSFAPYAFGFCTELTEVNLPKVTTFSDDGDDSTAFYECEKLTTVNMPEVTTFGNYVFQYCYALETITLPKATTFGDNAFDSCTSLTTINLPKVTSFGSSAFTNCTDLTSVSLPEAITFGSGAFSNCQNLTTVDLPKATTFGLSAFNWSKKLTTVNLPSATNFTGNNLFNGCDVNPISLTLGSTIPSNVNFGSGVPVAGSTLTLPTQTDIDNYDADSAPDSDDKWNGFALQINQIPIEINSTVPADDASEIDLDDDLEIEFNQNVVKGTGNITLKKVSDNSTVETIDVTSTKVSVSGSDVTINPSSDLPLGQELYVMIDNTAFKNANDLYFGGISDKTTWSFTTKSTVNDWDDSTQTITIHTQWSGTIEDEFGRLCGSPLLVKNLVITDGVITDDDCDWMSEKLDNIETLNISGTSAFEDNYIPDKFFSSRSYYYNIETLKTAYIEPTNPELHFEGAALAGVDALTYVKIPKAKTFQLSAMSSCKNLTTVILPEAVSFGDYSFSSPKALTTIELPKATTFGDDAFSEALNLTTIILPEATTFGDNAFKACLAAEIELPKATTFGDNAFRYCTNLQELKLPLLETIGASLSLQGCNKVNLYLDDTPPSSATLSHYNPLSKGSTLTVSKDAVSTYDPTSSGYWKGWAVITPPSYTITYDANGGSGAGSQSDAENAVVTLNDGRSFSYSGYVLEGWTISGTRYELGALYTLSSDVTAYAYWVQDSDEDGVSDPDETKAGTDPADPNDEPDTGTVVLTLLDSSGNPMVGCTAVLNSEPVTTTTDSEGKAVFAGVTLSPHTLSVRNGSTQLGSYNLDFTRTGSDSTTVANSGSSSSSSGSIVTTVSSSFLTLDILLQGNASGYYQIGGVTYTLRSDGTYGIAANPKTGESGFSDDLINDYDSFFK